MSYFLTLRTGLPSSHQFGRKSYASFEQARAAADQAFVSGAEYLIEDERGPITYRLVGSHGIS